MKNTSYAEREECDKELLQTERAPAFLPYSRVVHTMAGEDTKAETTGGAAAASTVTAKDKIKQFERVNSQQQGRN